MRSDRLKEELARAKLKAAEWQAKVKDLERRITLQENLEIVQAVRSVSATPEELRKILAQLTNMRDAPAEDGTGGQERADSEKPLRTEGENPAQAEEQKETDHQNPIGEEGKTE